MRGEVVEPASDGGEERGGVGIGVSGDERVEVAVTRGGADDVECPPLGIATAWGGVHGVLRWGGLWDVIVTGRAMGGKVGMPEEERGTSVATARPSD